MAYEKTEWKSGDTITAEKLNKIEDGIAEGGGSTGPLYFNIDNYDEEADNYISNVTFGEIYEAFKIGRPIIFKSGDEQIQQLQDNIHYYMVTEVGIDYATLRIDGEDIKFLAGRIIASSYDSLSAEVYDYDNSKTIEQMLEELYSSYPIL